VIELCDFYTTTGYPNFKPKCLKGRRASLKCHKRECKCPEYKVTRKEMSNAQPVTISKKIDKGGVVVVEAESTVSAQAAMKDALEAINLIKKK